MKLSQKRAISYALSAKRERERAALIEKYGLTDDYQKSKYTHTYTYINYSPVFKETEKRFREIKENN